MNIVLIEDNPADQLLVREALAAGQSTSQLHVIADGLEAIEFLRRRGKFSKSVRPDLILLDLNIPGRSGKEVLKEIKTDPHLAFIPVVVFSSSKSEKDVKECYELHANSYITKPIDLDEFFHTIKAIEHFWMRAAKA